MGKKAKKKVASAAKGAAAAAKSAEARAMAEDAARIEDAAVRPASGASASMADEALAPVRVSEAGGAPDLCADGGVPSGVRTVAPVSDAAGGLLPDAAFAAGTPAPDAAAEDEGCPAADRAADAGACCTCRHKSTERSQAFQADVQKRLNRAIGQLNGVKAMIDDNRYCGDVLVQLAASEAAVRRVSEIILQDHLETCVVEQIRAGNVEVVDEAMKLIRKFM